jgi:single-stranded DNA-binding protein
METLNLVVISGNISSDAVLYESNGIEYCDFSVVTFRSAKTDSGKVKSREEHHVTMFRPGTISKYLTKGKSVLIQGRVAPANSKGPNIIATSVTFPGRNQDA